MREQGLPDDQIDAAMALQKNVIGPVVTPLLGFISVMLIGTVLSLITSIFMRRSEPVANK